MRGTRRALAPSHMWQIWTCARLCPLSTGQAERALEKNRKRNPTLVCVTCPLSMARVSLVQSHAVEPEALYSGVPCLNPFPAHPQKLLFSSNNSHAGPGPSPTEVVSMGSASGRQRADLRGACSRAAAFSVSPPLSDSFKTPCSDIRPSDLVWPPPHHGAGAPLCKAGLLCKPRTSYPWGAGRDLPPSPSWVDKMKQHKNSPPIK